MSKIDVNKVTNTLGDAIKLAANLSDSAKEKKEMSYITDDSNSTQTTNPNQQVQIHIGDQDKKKEEPVVIHEKPETHIHKEFPDERALTDKECELALAKAKMENDYKNRELEYRQYKEDLDRRDRLNNEALKRKDKEEQRAKNERKEKIAGIVCAILGVLTTAGIGYAIYSDCHNQRLGTSSPKIDIAINGEGNVE